MDSCSRSRHTLWPTVLQERFSHTSPPSRQPSSHENNSPAALTHSPLGPCTSTVSHDANSPFLTWRNALKHPAVIAPGTICSLLTAHWSFTNPMRVQERHTCSPQPAAPTSHPVLSGPSSTRLLPPGACAGRSSLATCRSSQSSEAIQVSLSGFT